MSGRRIIVCAAFAAALLLAAPVMGAAQCRPLTCDRPVEGSVSGPTLNCFSFDVIDGEIVEVAVSVANDEVAMPRWRLVDASGSAAGACGAFTLASRMDCGPLSAAGNPHRVEVMGAGAEETAFLVQLQRLTAAQMCEDDAGECSIDPRSDSDLIGFNVVANDPVAITVVAAEAGENFEPYWRLLDGAGTPAAKCGAFTLEPHVTCGPLPISGNPYRIEVTDLFGDGEGAYEAAIGGHSLCMETPEMCIGDCDADESVGVHELVRGVNIALGDLPLNECRPLDRNRDGVVTVDELVAAVFKALNGC